MVGMSLIPTFGFGIFLYLIPPVSESPVAMIQDLRKAILFHRIPLEVLDPTFLPAMETWSGEGTLLSFIIFQIPQKWRPYLDVLIPQFYR
ncbi:hypothetical protein SK128_027071 [Halocaridina rubra]|uniref:Uncharacterized protein n=1 Tax=Halocaridina rubra TaxID=373956 RepID=A0AAN8X306_HALRR